MGINSINSIKHFIVIKLNCNYIVDPGKVEMIDARQYPLNL